MKFSLSDKPMQWTGVAGGFILWLAGWMAWTQNYPSFELRNQLMRWIPFFLWVGCLSGVAALWLNRSLLWRGARKVATPRQWLVLAGVGLLSFILVRGVAPRTHRLFFDEDIYEAIALNIAQNNRAAMMNDGRWEHGRFVSRLSELNKQPNGWPFTISLPYRLFGVSETVAFNLANFLFVMAVLAVFLAGRLLFDDFWPALWAALIYAMTPVNVRWFSTVDGDPPTSCFTALAMVATLLCLRFRTASTFFLMVSAWAWACQFRFEVALLGLLVFLMFYVEGWEELKTPRLYGFLLLCLFLLSSHLVQLYAVRSESWGSSGEKLALNYVWSNLKTNTVYYFDSKAFPVLFSLLAIVGCCWKRHWKAKLYAGLWFLLSWGIFLFFYAGSYSFGVDVRYATLSMAPLALMAGLGISHLVAWGQRRFKTVAVFGMASVVLGGTLLAYLPEMRALGAESWECRADHAAAEAFSRLVPEDGIVLTSNPNMFQVFGNNAAQLSLLTPQNPYADQALKPRFRDKIYVHWNYWCNTQSPVQVRFCQDVMASYKTELISERTVDHQRFALYRVLGDLAPSSSPPFLQKETHTH